LPGVGRYAKRVAEHNRLRRARDGANNGAFVGTASEY